MSHKDSGVFPSHIGVCNSFNQFCCTQCLRLWNAHTCLAKSSSTQSPCGVQSPFRSVVLNPCCTLEALEGTENVITWHLPQTDANLIGQEWGLAIRNFNAPSVTDIHQALKPSHWADIYFELRQQMVPEGYAIWCRERKWEVEASQQVRGKWKSEQLTYFFLTSVSSLW